VQLEVQALQAGHGGLVRLGAMLVAATVLVPRVVGRLQAEPGSVQLELVEDILQGLWPRLERGELDLVVCRIDARVRASGLPVEALYEDPHVVVCGPHHALARRQTVTWADTLHHPWVLPPRSTPLRSALESSFNAVGLPPPAADIASASLSATQAILQSTDALAVMSRSAALHFQAQALVKSLPLELPYDIGPVGVAWLQPDPGPAVSRVLQALRDEGGLLARGG
jgi:DNA-binding transcriptional LysR family regulator